MGVKVKCDFAVVLKSHTMKRKQIDEVLLRKEGLFKTLSLLLASRTRIKIPATLLMLEWNLVALKKIIAGWRKPVMVRVDYRTLPAKKPLGGIPVYSQQKITKVCNFLYEKGCLPLLHPHIDRFSDEYSAGVIIRRDESDCLVEIVGKGFDASDLRLGASSSHESMRAEIVSGSIVGRSEISQRAYARDRERRIVKAASLKRYTEYVNEEGRLLASLERFRKQGHDTGGWKTCIPLRYTKIPKSCLRELMEIVFVLYTEVVRGLPYAAEYVASLSHVEEKGWILWDVYASWYNR